MPFSAKTRKGIVRVATAGLASQFVVSVLTCAAGVMMASAAYAAAQNHGSLIYNRQPALLLKWRLICTIFCWW